MIADRFARTAALHASFAALARARRPREIFAHLLGAAQRVLRFERGGIFAHAVPAAGCRGELRLIAYVDDAPLDRPPELACSPAGCALRRAASGAAEELDAPALDVRGWYVLAPLAVRARPTSVLYLDGSSRCVPDAALLELTDALCAVAGAALENAYEFRRTRTLATRDPLTGLLNRRGFRARLERELERCVRRSARCACVMLDLDDLKRINDSGGHALGDAVLKRVAETLLQNARSCDLIGRLGGDEFAVALIDVDTALTRDLLRRHSSALAANGLRCSLGAALASDAQGDADALLRAADAALYRVKSTGKNGYAFGATP